MRRRTSLLNSIQQRAIPVIGLPGEGRDDLPTHFATHFVFSGSYKDGGTKVLRTRPSTMEGGRRERGPGAGPLTTAVSKKKCFSNALGYTLVV